MDAIDKAAVTGLLVIVLLVILGMAGYVKNVVKFCHSDFRTVNAEVVLRSAGLVVVPLGVIEGFIDFDHVTEREQKGGK